MLYKSRKVVIKLFNDYSSIASEDKYKAINKKGITRMSERVVKVSGTKVSNRKVSDHSNLKVLSPKQVCQKLPIALAQIKAGNTSENFLDEIRKIICFLCREKEIAKKVYNNIINSIKL